MKLGSFIQIFCHKMPKITFKAVVCYINGKNKGQKL